MRESEGVMENYFIMMARILPNEKEWKTVIARDSPHVPLRLAREPSCAVESKKKTRGQDTKIFLEKRVFLDLFN